MKKIIFIVLLLCINCKANDLDLIILKELIYTKIDVIDVKIDNKKLSITVESDKNKSISKIITNILLNYDIKIKTFIIITKNNKTVYKLIKNNKYIVSK